MVFLLLNIFNEIKPAKSLFQVHFAFRSEGSPTLGLLGLAMKNVFHRINRFI